MALNSYMIVSAGTILFIIAGIRLMNSARTAVLGNYLSALGMLVIIGLTILEYEIAGKAELWTAIAIGTGLGVFLAVKATMTQIPQLVALLNGVGGGASMLVALIIIGSDAGEISVISRVTAALALWVGAVTLSGSLVAAGKLDNRIRQTPVILKRHVLITQMLLAGAALLIILIGGGITGHTLPLSMILLILSLTSGTVGVLRIGGADMPIAISLLNSLSGLAAAISGLAIANFLLVAVGAIIGAGGIILTGIMCRAMNRRLRDILMASNTIAYPAAAPVVSSCGGVVPTDVSPLETCGQWLRSAKTVVIVPGYGMALAQAQQQVGRLFETLESQEMNVLFAIHPVAGRMPGHMNVLLAEAGIPYDKLKELDTANAQFQKTDVVIVIGANDVVNPAARTAEGTPIYGMPVLNVDQAKRVIICNKDTQPGYAGVANPLYDKHDHVLLLLGNAMETVRQLTDILGKS